MRKAFLIPCFLTLLISQTFMCIDAQEFRFERPQSSIRSKSMTLVKSHSGYMLPRLLRCDFPAAICPNSGQGGLEMKKADNGVWEVSTEKVPAEHIAITFQWMVYPSLIQRIQQLANRI